LADNVITIKNVGFKVVSVLEMRVNEREDCPLIHPLGMLVGALDQTKFSGPRKLDVGDQFLLASPKCNIVRVAVKTDRGEWTYSFAK
jgi:hypothetical protein